MKKFLILLCLLALCFGCSPEQDLILRTVNYQGIKQEAVQVAVGSTYTVPSTLPEKEGYDLILKLDGKEIKLGQILTVDSDITIECSYIPKTYHIHFEGIDKEDIPASYGTTFEVPELPKKEHHKLTIYNGNEKISIGQKLEITGDVKLTCKYEPLTYTVSFEGIDITDSTYSYGEEFIVPSDIPEREHYKLIIKNGEETLSPGQKIIVTDDITITCKYEPNFYTVTFSGITREDMLVDKGKEFTVPDDIPVKVGHTLILKIADKTVSKGETIPIDGDITILCQYVPDTYKITFEGIDSNFTAEYGSPYEIPDLANFNPGYRLVKVVTNGKEYNTGDKVDITADTTFQCTWQKTWKLTIDGSSEIVDDESEYIWKTEKENHKFVGAALNGKQVTDFKTPIKIKEDTTIDYEWIRICTVSYRGITRNPETFDEGSAYTIPLLDNVYIGSIRMNGKKVSENETYYITGDTVIDFDVKDYTPEIKFVLKSDGEYTIDGIDSTYNGPMVIPNRYNGIPVTSITPQTSFNIYKNITELFIPETITIIANDLFREIPGLKAVHLPDTMTKLGVNAFTNTGIKTIHIPASLTAASSAFAICPDLMTITVDEGNPRYTAVNNCFIEKTTGTLIRAAGNSELPQDGTIREIKEDAFWNLKNIRRVHIPDSVDHLPAKLFFNCTNLEYVYIPSSVKTEGCELFNGVNAVEVEFGEGWTKIHDDILEHENGLTHVILPDTVETIGKRAFHDCPNLESIVIPASLKTIGAEPFTGCTKLSRVEFKPGITSIPANMFQNCHALKTIIIPASVVNIGNYAFSGAPIENFVLPSSVNVGYASIGSAKSVIVEEGRTRIDKGIFDGNSNLESIILPEGLVNIGDGAFMNCTSLQSINIPASVTDIGPNAFNNCSSLKSITIPGSVNTIHENTFAGCSGVNIILENGVKKLEAKSFQNSKDFTITIPASITSSPSPFNGCTGMNIVLADDIREINSNIFRNTSISSIVLPEGLEHIDPNAFENASINCTLTLPSTLKSIGQYAFQNCNNFTIELKNLNFKTNSNSFNKATGIKVIITSGITEIPASAFSNFDGMVEISIPDSVASIGNRAFFGTQLKKLVIPASVTSIGEGILNRCDQLKSLEMIANENYQVKDNCLIDTRNKTLIGFTANAVIPSDGSVTRIGRNVGTAGKTTLTIPSGITEIMPYAFEYGKCTSIEIPDSVTVIGDHAFANSSLVSIKLPSGLETIEPYTFLSNNDLISVELPSTVKNIGDSAFSGCSKLKTVNFPSSIERIGMKAFANLAIEHLNLPEGVTEIAKEAFYSNDKLLTVSIPSTVTTMGEDAFRLCRNITTLNVAKHKEDCTPEKGWHPNWSDAYMSESITYLP